MKRIAIATTMLMVAACGSNATGTDPDARKAADADPHAPDADPHAPDANPSAPDANLSAPDAMPSSTGPIIFTILLENHDYAEIVSKTAGDKPSKDAPYVNSLIKQYGLATSYKDTGHPSLPNYLNMISGDNQTPLPFDFLPSQFGAPFKNGNLGDQMTTAGIKWRSYQESMGKTTPCRLTDDPASPGLYACKHDPFLYFDNIQNGANNLCKNTNVDFDANFATDLAAGTYRYMWITPNLTSDGHDGAAETALKTSDNWVKTVIGKIMLSDGYKNGGVIFLTWDESEGRGTDDPDLVPMIVISPRIKTAGMTSSTAFTHQSYLATIEDMLGLPRLATVTSAAPLTEFLKP